MPLSKEAFGDRTQSGAELGLIGLGPVKVSPNHICCKTRSVWTWCRGYFDRLQLLARYWSTARVQRFQRNRVEACGRYVWRGVLEYSRNSDIAKCMARPNGPNGFCDRFSPTSIFSTNNYSRFDTRSRFCASLVPVFTVIFKYVLVVWNSVFWRKLPQRTGGAIQSFTRILHESTDKTFELLCSGQVRNRRPRQFQSGLALVWIIAALNLSNFNSILSASVARIFVGKLRVRLHLEPRG